MMGEPAMLDKYLKECLYFTTSRLHRTITKFAEEEFARCGLSPTAAYLLMILIEQDGVNQKDLGARLHLQPSTVTRLIDKLADKQLVTSKMDGRMSMVTITSKGKELESVIQECWMNLRARYSKFIGEAAGDELSLQLYDISGKLEES
jgi:DNA-binding MarR family transcriptional regulator